MQVPDRLRSPAVWILAALIAAGGLTIAFTDNGPDHGKGKPRRALEIHIGSQTKVDSADPDAKPNDVVELTPGAQAVAKDFAADRADLKGNLRGPDAGPVAKLLPPFAADEVPGCRTRFLKTNWSNRTVPQSQVILFWLHFTGGPDKPDTRSEVDGLTAFGNSPAARVSWHFNMDKDGNCDYNVPLRYKAWTEAGANSTGISIEVAGNGSGDYLRPGGLHQLARIYRAVHRAYPGVKLRLGGVSNCVPAHGGFVTHWQGGPCSGGHTDIHPHRIEAVIAQLRKLLRPRPTKHDLWLAHRTAVHLQYAARCPRHHGNTAECAALRSRARTLDRLIARR